MGLLLVLVCTCFSENAISFFETTFQSGPYLKKGYFGIPFTLSFPLLITCTQLALRGGGGEKTICTRTKDQDLRST